MAVANTTDREPTHPGAIIREDVIPALKMPVASVARSLGVSRQLLHRIMAEEAPITPAMALRLGKFCGNGPGLWLRMQATHDLWHAERAMQKELGRIRKASVDEIAD